MAYFLDTVIPDNAVFLFFSKAEQFGLFGTMTPVKGYVNKKTGKLVSPYTGLRRRALKKPDHPLSGNLFGHAADEVASSHIQPEPAKVKKPRKLSPEKLDAFKAKIAHIVAHAKVDAQHAPKQGEVYKKLYLAKLESIKGIPADLLDEAKQNVEGLFKPKTLTAPAPEGKAAPEGKGKKEPWEMSLDEYAAQDVRILREKEALDNVRMAAAPIRDALAQANWWPLSQSIDEKLQEVIAKKPTWKRGVKQGRTAIQEMSDKEWPKFFKNEKAAKQLQKTVLAWLRGYKAGWLKPEETISSSQFHTYANHHAIVKQALADGKPVPPEVLADYPDLKDIKPKAKAAPVQAAPQGKQENSGITKNPIPDRDTEAQYEGAATSIRQLSAEDRETFRILRGTRNAAQFFHLPKAQAALDKLDVKLADLDAQKKEWESSVNFARSNNFDSEVKRATEALNQLSVISGEVYRKRIKAFEKVEHWKKLAENTSAKLEKMVKGSGNPFFDVASQSEITDPAARAQKAKDLATDGKTYQGEIDAERKSKREAKTANKVVVQKDVAEQIQAKIDNSQPKEDGPKEGERNADGLVFRNGRWYREEDKTESPKNQEKRPEKFVLRDHDGNPLSIRDAAKYLKDVAYSLGEIVDTDVLNEIMVSGELSKSGRDTMLMDAFSISRYDAHSVNNDLDHVKPNKLRAVDMEDAFNAFPALRKIIESAKKEVNAQKASKKANEQAYQAQLLNVQRKYPDLPLPMQEHRARLLERARRHDEAKAAKNDAVTVKDVTPVGYGPSDSSYGSQDAPIERLTTEQQRLQDSINTGETILRGNVSGAKRAMIERSVKSEKEKLEKENQNIAQKKRGRHAKVKMESELKPENKALEDRPKKGKAIFSRGEVVIKDRRGDDILVKGPRVGDFLVQTLGKKSYQEWKVIHIPSKRAVYSHFDDKNDALKVAHQLSLSEAKWDGQSDDPPDDFKEKMNKVLNPYFTAQVNKHYKSKNKAPDDLKPGDPEPDPESVNYETMVKIAADSISKLRAVDVYRVLEESPNQNRAGLASYIKQHRPDLVDDVDDAMIDLPSIDPEPPKPTSPAPKKRGRPAKVKSSAPLIPAAKPPITKAWPFPKGAKFLFYKAVRA